MTTSEKVAALVDARARIADPARWTQFRYARDKRGHAVGPAHSTAVSWCAIGTLAKTAALHPDVSYSECLTALSEGVPGLSIVGLNDRGTKGAPGQTPYAAVLAAYDDAIARLQAEVTP